MPSEVAWLAVAIFAVHPIQSEAVNYIFARSTLLMSCFCLLSFNEWLRDGIGGQSSGSHWRCSRKRRRWDSLSFSGCFTCRSPGTAGMEANRGNVSA